MKTDGIDQWKFSVVTVSDDVLTKETRDLILISDDDHVAGQRISSNDLSILTSRTVDDMRPSFGHPSSIRDELLSESQDEDTDKISLWSRLSKLFETTEQGDARYRLTFESGPSVLYLYCVLEPSYDCRSILTLWEKILSFKECIISVLDEKTKTSRLLDGWTIMKKKESLMVCRNRLDIRGNEEIILCNLTVHDYRLLIGGRFLWWKKLGSYRYKEESWGVGSWKFSLIKSRGWLILGDKGTKPRMLGMELTEKEHPSSRQWIVRTDVHETMTVNQISGQGDDHCSNQVSERRIRRYVRYHLSVTLGTWAGVASTWTETDTRIVTWQETRGGHPCLDLES